MGPTTWRLSPSLEDGSRLPLCAWYVFSFSLFYVSLILTLMLATSVNVERLFSRGRLVLSHVRSRLSVQTTRAILCLNSWSRNKLVNTEDVLLISKEEDLLDGEAEPKLERGWDKITL